MTAPNPTPTMRRPKPRRVTRGVTRLGASAEGLTKLPVEATPAKTPPTAPTPQGSTAAAAPEVLPRRAAEDTDYGAHNGNDARLLRDKPPHWG